MVYAWETWDMGPGGRDFSRRQIFEHVKGEVFMPHRKLYASVRLSSGTGVP